MTAQHEMILSVLDREQRGETFREAEFRAWAREVQDMQGVNCEFKHAFRIYCQDLTSCSSRELINVLGGLASVKHNALQLVKLIALQRQMQVAQDFLNAVEMAIDAVSCDGFDSDWYRAIVSKDTPQQPPSISFQLDTGEVISDNGELASTSSRDKRRSVQ